MASIFGDILSGGLGVYGYNELMDRLGNQQNDMNTTLDKLQSGVQEQTGFTPWGVTSNLGTTSVTPQGINFGLTPQQQGVSDQMRTGAQNLFGYASQDPTQMQNAFFGQLQGARQPAFQQAFNNLNQGVWGTGTGGMRTAAFGGNPRDYAFSKGLADSQAADMLMAQQMAQAQQAQAANIGQQMFGNQYTPLSTSANLMQYGINNQQLRDQMTREAASLWTQLGLGGLSTNVNYDNIRAKAFGDMIGAMSPLAQSAGNAVSNAWNTGEGLLGSFFDWITNTGTLKPIPGF